MSNVRDFGAMGDGMADDTGSIEHALRDGGDGVLEFPRGEYRLTRTISFDLDKTRTLAIHGSGGTARVLMHGSGPAFEFVGHHGGSADPNSFKPEVWVRERMPTVSQIEIEGKHPEADGLRFKGVMQPTLTGVLIRRVRNAVHITERCRNVLISHCHLYHNTGIGVWLDRVNLHQTNIIGNHISYCRLGGIRIDNSEIRNLQITGNDIEYNNYRAFNMPEAADVPTAEIYIDCSKGGTVREGTIASNTIQATYNPNGANIRIIGGASEHSHLAGMWCISGNLIGSQATNVHLTLTRGITFEGNYVYSGHHRNLLAEDCQNLVIGANCFGHNPDYKEKELCTGIRLVDCKNCTLTGLQIQDAQAGEHTVAGVVPIKRQGLVELVRCRQMTLTGLQVLEGSPFGLYLEDCSETMLTGCSFLDTREKKQTQASVKWTGTGKANAIAHCRANRGLQVPEHVKLNDNLLDE
ncbi:MAG: right-handed parallel beta-helix repeat-containing protein [Candidatus Saccharimonas sp.]|nr:right-handed parallel beta-helix repeat-containing protein [Planctomycetaceae bacterium]